MRASFLSIFAAAPFGGAGRSRRSGRADRFGRADRRRRAGRSSGRFTQRIACLLLFVAGPALWIEADTGNASEAPPPTRGVLSNLSRDQYRELQDEGSLKSFFTDGVELELAPDLRGVDDIREALETMDPKVGIESLFLLSESLPGDSEAERELTLYNIFRSISTMEGIEYYSASRERMRVFYKESYVINNPDDKDRRDDPLVSEIPETDTIHVFQRDSSFGRNVYEVEYRHRDDKFFMSMTNLTRMYYRIAPVVAPENLEIHLTVVETEDGYLFYGATGVDVITLLGLEDRVKDSFSNRVEAIFRWFQSRIEDRQAESE